LRNITIVPFVTIFIVIAICSPWWVYLGNLTSNLTRVKVLHPHVFFRYWMTN
jgi:hypothetical membrane protein